MISSDFANAMLLTKRNLKNRENFKSSYFSNKRIQTITLY